MKQSTHQIWPWSKRRKPSFSSSTVKIGTFMTRSSPITKVNWNPRSIGAMDQGKERKGFISTNATKLTPQSAKTKSRLKKSILGAKSREGRRAHLRSGEHGVLTWIWRAASSIARHKEWGARRRAAAERQWREEMPTTSQDFGVWEKGGALSQINGRRRRRRRGRRERGDWGKGVEGFKQE